jgi:hypothetical protein
MTKHSLLAGVATLMLLAGAASANNERIMADAALQLRWDYQNRAFFLVKQETIVSPVAVIFGYADNAAACEEMASALSRPEARAGTFECVPIY